MEKADDPKHIFATNLGVLAANNGLKQSKVGARVGLSQSSVSRYMTGSAAATIDHVAKVAGAFKLQAWQVLVPGMTFPWSIETAQWANWIESLTPEEMARLRKVAGVVREDHPTESAAESPMKEPAPRRVKLLGKPRTDAT